jgi:hypothetical protein
MQLRSFHDVLEIKTTNPAANAGHSETCVVQQCRAPCLFEMGEKEQPAGKGEEQAGEQTPGAVPIRDGKKANFAGNCSDAAKSE